MLNRFEAFNLSIMSKMQNRRPQAPVLMSATPARSGVPAAAESHAQGAGTTSGAVMGDATGTAGQTAASAGGASAKKKKPKKKK